MPKVNNTAIYNLDSSVTLNDFLFGTDFETLNKQNKNFSLKSVYNLFKSLDDQSTTVSSFYTYSQGISYLTKDSIFNTNSPVFSEINVFNLGTKNKLVFEFLKEYKDSFLLNIVEIGNPNIIDYFEIGEIVDVEVDGEVKGVDISVSLYKGMELGVLTDEKTYSVGIVLKTESKAPSFIVSLPAGRTLGKYNTGDVVPEFDTVQEQIKDIGQVAIAPTFTPPTISIISEPVDSETYEIGTTLNLTFFSIFVKKDGGNLISKKYQKDGLDLPGNTDTIILSDSNVIYNSYADYEAGTVSKTDVLGNEYPNPIQAGNVKSVNIAFRGYSAIFFGSVSSKPTTSAEVRLLNKRLENSGSVFILNTGTTNINYSVWLPDSRSIVSVIDLDALNADITTSYVSENLSVNDANNEPGNGTLYTMTQGVPYQVNHRHQITISQ